MSTKPNYFNEYNQEVKKSVDNNGFNIQNNTSDFQSIMKSVKQLRVGAGEKSVNFGKEGIWLGGKSFNTSIIRFTLDGKMFIRDKNGVDRVKIAPKE